MFNSINNIIYKASEIMLSALDVSGNVSAKSGDANFVTKYDVAVEGFLIEELSKKFPEANFIGEEQEENRTELIENGLSFIIDPIDGTTNFIQNYRHSTISVGLCDRGEMIFGTVYDPYTDRLFTAERGCGAFLIERKSSPNKLAIRETALIDSLACFGTSPYYKDKLGKAGFDMAYKTFMHARDIRRSGSAALEFTSVASDVFGIFFECFLSPWDFAAGSLLVAEAGGITTDMDGNALKFTSGSSILSGNKRAHSEWRELMSDLL